MRIVPPVLKALLVLLLVLAVGGFIGWQSRHQWLPAVANWALDGIYVQKIEELELAGGGKDLSLKRLQLSLTNGVLLNVQDIHVSSWLAWLGLSDKATRVDIQSASISKAPDTLGSAATASSKAGKEAPPAREQQPSPIASKAINTSTELLTLNALQQRLRNLPALSATVHSLRWEDRFSGTLNVIVNKNDSNIEGIIKHSECAECQATIALNDLLDQLSLTLRLGNPDASALRATMQATKIPAEPAQTELRWHVELSAQAEAQPATKLLEALGKIGRQTPTMHLPADIGSGSLSFTASANVSDLLEKREGTTDIVAALSAKAVQMQVPPSLSGLKRPVNLLANSTQPIQLEAETLRPLKVTSLNGKLLLTVDAEKKTPDGGNPNTAPLIRTEIDLNGDQSSRVSLHGDMNVAQFSGLLPEKLEQSLVGPYAVDNLIGNIRFQGGAELPTPDDLLQQKGLAAQNIQIQFQPDSKIAATLISPPSEHPLQSIGWNLPRIQLQLDQTVSIQAPAWPGDLALKAPLLSLSAVNLRAMKSGKPAKPTAASEPQLTAQISDLDCSNLPNADCRLNIAGNLSTLILPSGLDAQDLKFTFNAALNPRKSKGSVPLSTATLTNLNFSADKLAINAVSINKPELFSQDAACNWKGDSLHCTAPQAAIGIAPVTFTDTSLSGVIHLDSLSISRAAQNAPFTMESKFHSDSLVVAIQKQFQLELSSSGQFSLRGDALTGSSQVQANNLSVTSDWKHNLESGRGELALTMPPAHFSTNRPLSGVIKGLPVDIVDGTVATEAHFNWPDGDGRPQSNKVKVQLDAVSAVYNDIVAVGIDGDVSLVQSGKNWVSERASPVTITRLDAGIPVDNLHFDVSLAKNQDLRLSGFAGEMLEGALTSDSLVWNLSGEERHSVVAFTGLSLQALAKEMEAENFVASGLLDARLPLTTDRQGVTIENGTLDARAPGGRLRYYGAFSPSMLTSNPQLKLIAGALEDYNYRAMHGTITYPLSGDLKLNLKLTGRSAAVDANRDLVINLNLENNVPSMLKSLQASRDLTDVLEDAVQ